MENWIYIEKSELWNQVIVNTWRVKEHAQIMSGIANVNSDGLPKDVSFL